MSYFGTLFGSYALPVTMTTHGEEGVLTIVITVGGVDTNIVENHDCVVFPEEEIDTFNAGRIYTKEMSCVIETPINTSLIWGAFQNVLLAEAADTVLLAEDGSVLVDETMAKAAAFIDDRLTNAKVILATTDRGVGTWSVTNVLTRSENVLRLELRRKPPKGMSRSGFRVGE